jgi:hypothetical protein
MRLRILARSAVADRTADVVLEQACLVQCRVRDLLARAVVYLLLAGWIDGMI